MPYVEAITEAGTTVEVERYYTSRYQKKGICRGKKKKPTPEEQKKVNSRQAEKKLRRLINANFKGDDYHVILTYIRNKDEPNRTRDEMRDDIAKFLRALRKEYRKKGEELKYIHVMEIGQKGARHHHLIINHIDTTAVTGAWPHARAQIFPLDHSGQYGQLASYLVKYTDRHLGEGTEAQLQGKRWAASKNLIHPVTERKIITKSAWFRSEAKVPHKYSGRYYIDQDSIRSGVNEAEYSGYGFFTFTMRMLC